jgi:hypothetical protein
MNEQPERADTKIFDMLLKSQGRRKISKCVASSPHIVDAVLMFSPRVFQEFLSENKNLKVI